MLGSCSIDIGDHALRNWARRNTCNVCNTPKPGTVDVNREGHGGGFKELDEEEVAEARRRREEFENDDTEMCVSKRHPTPAAQTSPAGSAQPF